MSRVLDLLTPAHGQCRLSFVSATSLRLSPYGGQLLNINGLPCVIPAAGVTISNSGLANSTTYFVYAFMSGSSMTLELSTTGHSTHTTGIEIKTGDATRTLVGMARTTAAGQFASDATNLFVLSYFNRVRKIGRVALTANRTQNYALAYSEIHAELRINFLTWADDSVNQSITGSWAVSANGSLATCYASIDGDTTNPRQAPATGLTGQSSLATSDERVVAEGFHYGTLLGSCYLGAGTSVTYVGGQNGQVSQVLSVMG
jgi:hypothetical protein